jgi:hypothetical protein
LPHALIAVGSTVIPCFPRRSSYAPAFAGGTSDIVIGRYP